MYKTFHQFFHINIAPLHKEIFISLTLKEPRKMFTSMSILKKVTIQNSETNLNHSRLSLI